MSKLGRGSYSVYHKQQFRLHRGKCYEDCRCLDGELQCSREDDDDDDDYDDRIERKGRSNRRCDDDKDDRDYGDCRFQGREIEDGESFRVSCNTCRCRRGKVSCTKRACPGKRECIRNCTREDFNGPVCGPSAITFPNRCTAKCFGLNDTDLIGGPCNNRVSQYVHAYLCVFVWVWVCRCVGVYTYVCCTEKM